MPTKARKPETWRDWIPESEPKLTIGELVKMAAGADFEVDSVTLRFWQKEGVLPYPERKRIDRGTYAMYPMIALVFIEHVRDMQAAGLTLKEIKPRIRGLVDTFNDPDPYGLAPAIRRAAKRHTEMHGVPLSQVMVTFVSPVASSRTYVVTQLDESNETDSV